MNRYYHVKVQLESGADFQVKVAAENYRKFDEWIGGVPGVVEATPIKATTTLPPRSGKKTKIADARILAGMTQQEFADQLGVQVQQEQRWEYGVYTPKTATLMKMGEVLGIDWTTLIADQ